MPTCSFTGFAAASGTDKKMPRCAASLSPEESHVFIRCVNCCGNGDPRHTCKYCMEGLKNAVEENKKNAYLSPLMMDLLSIDWKGLDGSSTIKELNVLKPNMYEFARGACPLCEEYTLPDRMESVGPKFDIDSCRSAYNSDIPDVLIHPPMDVDDVITYLPTEHPSSALPLPARILYIGCKVAASAKDADLALKADAPLYENLFTIYKPPEEHPDGRSRHVVIPLQHLSTFKATNKAPSAER
jgi:hypothetical protein